MYRKAINIQGAQPGGKAADLVEKHAIGLGPLMFLRWH